MISTIERLNPFLPEVIADPYPVYRQYRETDPVHWGITPNSRLSGTWYVFRYADVMQILDSPKLGGKLRKFEVMTLDHLFLLPFEGFDRW